MLWLASLIRYLISLTEDIVIDNKRINGRHVRIDFFQIHVALTLIYVLSALLPFVVLFVRQTLF